MAKAVIFDVDGTLIDSVDLHTRAWQDAFAEYGHTIDFDDIRSQIGKGGDQLLPVFLTPAQRDEVGEALETRRGHILKSRYLPQLRPFTAVPALLERLRQDGVRVVLASSAKADELATYKRIAGIEHLVDAETSSDDAEASKPHPDIFEAALRKIPDIAPADVVVVGDTPYDAEAAGKAGLRIVGVLCGGFAEADLRHAGCAAIYVGPAHLLARYEGSLLAPG